MNEDKKTTEDVLASLGAPADAAYNVPLNTTRKTVMKSQGKKDWVTAGSYRRKTITLEPEMIDAIKEITDREGYGVLEFYRWLVAHSLAEYRKGVRPSTEQGVRAIDVDAEPWRGK